MSVDSDVTSGRNIVDGDKTVYQAREFAAMAGVTVRTLHHYDRVGLLRPKRRTAAGYRLYESGELERLERIIALKYLGLSLRQIRLLLERDEMELSAALGLQRRLLEAKRLLLDRAIQAIADAESRMRNEGADRSSLLKKIIEVMEMANENDWMEQYHTEESRAKVEARRTLWSPELQERVSRQWSELIAEVQASVNEDPAGEKGQALAARWKALVEEFTGRDKDISQSVGKMWADRANWPVDVSQKAPVIAPEVWGFINRAMAAARQDVRPA